MPLKHACQLQEKRRPSLKPHTNHASCLRGLRYNTFTKKTNFSFCPYRSADVRLGKMVWIISVRSALRLIKSSQTSLLTSTNRNNPLVCERSRKRNKSYGIFPSTWYLTASLTRYCCVHVVQPTAPVRCALSSAQLQCAERVCCASGEVGAHPCGEAEQMCSWSLSPSVC